MQGPGIACAGVLALLPAPAVAHSFGQVYTLPVPFWLYAWAAATTLVVSFAIAGFFMAVRPEAATGAAPAHPARELPAALVRGLQAFSVALLALCIATGFWGTRVAIANFNMTFFWIVFVLGFAYLTALIGDLYALVNPWRVLSHALARVLPSFGRGRIAYPAAAAYWPALALYAGFIAFELFARSTPFSLAVALSAYTALNLLAVWLVGEAAWFRHGEFFAVFMRLIARLAPVEFVDADGAPARHWRWRRPFRGLLDGGAVPVSLLLFALFMLSSTAFDALHASRPWVRWFWVDLYRDVFAPWLGANPFSAFPVMARIYPYWQTGWLLMSPFVYLTAYLVAIGALWRLTARRHAFRELASSFMPSLLPIVLVYHMTHYYTLLQTQGVKIVALASDPFGFGWNLFGTARWLAGTIVPDVTRVWHIQVGLILAGHIVSVVVAHRQALALFRDRRRATLSQLPMLALMVAFTVAGLWLLSLPFEPAPR